MNTYNKALLGIYDDEPWLGGPASTGGTPIIPKKSIADSLSDWFSLAKQGAEILQTVKSDGTTTYVMPPPAAENNSMKYVMIGGGALLAIGAVVLLTRGGKKNALGSVAHIDGPKISPAKKAKKRKK